MLLIDIDDIQDSDQEVTEVLKRLTKPLFKPVHNDYAVTVNIQPTKFMNKRQWKRYTHDQQRAILSRIEKKFRKDMPTIELVELHYEICPTLKNIHFHALYKMPVNYCTTMETYYTRICSSEDEKTKIPWRFLDIREITNRTGWLEYINKDTKKA